MPMVRPKCRFLLFSGLLGLLVAGASCIGSQSTPCGDRVCADGRTCHETYGCLLPEQLVACDGLAAGDTCDFGAGPGYYCTDTICLLGRCGDGNVDEREECDGSNHRGATCQSLGFGAGSLRCSNACSFDTSQCSTCGDGAVGPGEQCDDGNTADNDGCDASCQSESAVTPIAYRLDSLAVRDPHVIVPDGAGCKDVMDTLSTDINPALATGINNLSINVLIVFRPLNQSGDGGVVEIGPGTCSSASTCGLNTVPPGPQSTVFANAASGSCLAPFPGTTSPSGYSPSIIAPIDNCFFTGLIDFTIEIGTVPITLRDVELAAAYNTDPADQLLEGLIRGFLSDDYAKQILVDVEGVPTQLSSLLPGGTNYACPAPFDYDDTDVGLDGVSRGWWVYHNFTAYRLSNYTGP